MRAEVKASIINQVVNSDIASTTFHCGPQGRFTLDLRVNYGTGTQNLVGVFYLRHRCNADADMEVVDGYEDFGDGPSGTKWRTITENEGASADEYDVFFDRTSGSGNIEVYVRTV